jgi:hypothetical protein
MMLLTKELRAKLPQLYSQEEQGLAAKAQVKFFSPYSNWTWYASEFDGEDLFFGLVDGFEKELGYFSLKELSELTISFAGVAVPAVERDRHWEPKTLKELLG